MTEQNGCPMEPTVPQPHLIYALHLGDHDYRYVGKTGRSIEKRLAEHCYMSKKLNYPVHKWIRKHGWDSIQCEILEECSPQEASMREISLIAKMRADGFDLLNCTIGGDGVVGRKHTEESKALMRKWHSQRPPMSKEARAKLSKSLTGRKYSLEARRRISASISGEKHGGAKLTEMQVKQIIQAKNSGERTAALAEKFGVSGATICDIYAGRSWPHVEGRPTSMVPRVYK